MTLNATSPAHRTLGFGLLAFWAFSACSGDLWENALGMRFVYIRAGSFTMGTSDPEEARMEIPTPGSTGIDDETPAHRVDLTRGFWMGETEVTQAQWLRVMQSRPGPTDFWEREDWVQLPVTGVSWRMARQFTEELGKLDPAYGYRLPTEAQWEYAARAGSHGLRPMELIDLDEYAWYIENSEDRPHPVATLEPNGFGLYDTLGNVWEWTADWYAPHSYTEGARSDPEGPASGRSKVRRGGSYHCPAHLVRPGYRAADSPDTRYSVLGFRLVVEPR
jgi:sulfatase modifying factor 1